MNNKEQDKDPVLLEVRNLSLKFPRQTRLAVDNVSFSIAAGSTLGLVGQSGAGKSSIARAIMHLLKVEAGEIRYRGESILQMDSRQLSAARQRIQLVFQSPAASLSPKRRIEQSLLEPLQHFAIGDSNSRQQKIREIITTVGLDTDALQRYPHQFSSGQQQRIAIARALVTDPELLIADEAVSALDVSVQAQILQLLQELQKKRGIALLFISHDLAVVRQIADEVAILQHGQLVEHTSADQFFNHPSHPYAKSLLAFANNEIPENMTTLDWHPDSEGY
jgi:ABC-type oligopeptide transport system ATPase subunit